MGEKSSLKDVNDDTATENTGEGSRARSAREGIGQIPTEGDPGLHTGVMAPAATVETSSSTVVADHGGDYEANTVRGGSTDTDDDIEAARARVEETRSHVSETIDAIQDRLNPSHLTEHAKDAVYDATVGRVQGAVSDVQGTAKDMGGTIVETIRQNPVPAALAGIGLGWLFMSMRRTSSPDRSQYRYGGYQPGRYPRTTEYGYGPGYRSSDFSGRSYEYQGAGIRGGESGGVGGRMRDVQDTARQAIDRTQDTAQRTVQGVQDTAGEVAGQVQDVAGQAQQTVRQAGYQAQQTGQQAVSGFQQMLQTNPLAVGLAALAVGAAVGLAIPESQKEDELMGEAKQSLVQTVQQRAQDTVQRVESVAQQTVNAAQETAQRAAGEQGLTT